MTKGKKNEDIGRCGCLSCGIHQSGKWYTNENINQMLMERHLAKKARNAKKKHHFKEPSKRTEEDDKRFEESLENMEQARYDLRRIYEETPDPHLPELAFLN